MLLCSAVVCARCQVAIVDLRSAGVFTQYPLFVFWLRYRVQGGETLANLYLFFFWLLYRVRKRENLADFYF